MGYNNIIIIAHGEFSDRPAARQAQSAHACGSFVESQPILRLAPVS